MAGFGDDVFARWRHIQSSLFPWLREELDPVTAALEQLIIVRASCKIRDRIDFVDFRGV